MKVMREKEVETKIQRLPEQARREVLDFAEFLILKYQKKEGKKKRFKFDWEGGLSGIKERLTSVELQHKALGWR